MKSILDVQVSCFANYITAENPAEVNLLQWLISNKHQAKVEQIRSLESKEERDAVKAALPAITPSGTFSQRKQECLIHHSGFLQFDIDWKGNTHITNYQDLKQQICNIPNVAYCGLSVSGTGFWGLIPIAYPDKHRQHFESLEKAFAHFGIVIDPAPKNVASLRGYSFDPEPYFNHQAALYQVYEQPAKRTYSVQSEKGGDKGKVEACIAEIERHRADLTGTYATWFEIGCSLANAFGEDGRDFFYRVSQFHPHYSPSKTDRQFTACLKGNSSFTIATFFSYCAQSQIRYKELVQPEADSQQNSPIYEVIPPEETKIGVEVPSPTDSPTTKRAAIYQVRGLMTWDMEELESFFSNIYLPAGPIQLLPWEKITDPYQFIRSHLSFIKSNNGIRSARPYYNRLYRLKTIMEAEAQQYSSSFNRAA